MRAQTLLRVDQTLLDEAQVAFRSRSITPETPINQIMFDAGVAKVLAWMEDQMAAKVRKATIQGTDDAASEPSETESALRRVLKGTANDHMG